MDEDHPPAPLQVQSAKGEIVTIEHVPSSKPIKYLGKPECIGNQKKTKENMKSKADGYARVANCSPLNRKGAHIFYRGIYKPSIDYLLPTTHFTYKELNKIQSKAHQAFVSKCGYRRSTALAVQYGPQHLGGIEFFHLYDLQGFEQIQCFIKYWRTPKSQSGSILRIVMSWVQYCAGIGQSVVTDTTTKLPHLEACWINSMRKYLATIGASLELKDLYVPEPQRDNDSYIMDHVIAHAKFKPAQIKAVNWCRMYLGVVTVADISNAAGTHIMKEMYHGNKDQVRTANNWHSVYQKKPNAKSWAQWRRACRLFATSQNLQLHTSLGNWTVPAVHMRRQWLTWQVPRDPILYILDQYSEEGTFTTHKRLIHDYDKDVHEDGQPLPAAAVPVDVTERPHTYTVQQNYCRWVTPPPPTLPPHDIIEYIHTLPLWEQELLGGLELLVSQAQFLDALVRGSMMVAADGSVQGHRASFGWVMSDSDGQRLARCNGPVHGTKPVPYRAEGYGILSVSLLFHHLKKRWQITNKFEMVSDNKTMVNRSNEKRDVSKAHPNSTMDAEWDVLAQIWTVIRELTEPSISWIKGHQDDKKPYHELSLMAQLNCDADEWADKYIAENPNYPYNKVPLFPISGVQLNLPTGTVTHKLKRELRMARHEEPLKEYLCEKFGWDRQVFADIDHESFRRALRKLDKHRTTLTKHVNDITPVGRRVHRYDPKYPRGCTSCGIEEETADHMAVCFNRAEWRQDCKNALNDFFEKWDTPLEIQELLKEGLNAVFDERTDVTACAESVQHINAAQKSIGWKELFRGRLSQSWRDNQIKYLGDRKTKKINGHTWAAALAKFFLQQWLYLWTARNEDRHGHDQQTKATVAKQQAIRETVQLYEYKGFIEPHLEWILATPLDEKIQSKTYLLRAFISSFGPILKKSHEYQTRLETG